MFPEKRGDFNPKRPGRFCNFSKNWIKKLNHQYLQLGVPEKQTNYSVSGACSNNRILLGFVA